MVISKKICVVIAAGVLLLGCQAVKVEPIGGDKIGMVLMHAKGDNTKRVDSLASSLRSAGVLVATPLMPWSRNRIYDRTYDDSMLEIDAAVKRLKSKGARRIVVGGDSMGANAALGYAARREGLAGVVLLAYGHVPSGSFFSEKLRAYVGQAKTMIDAGNGNKIGSFGDINQSGTSTRFLRADIYYSWFAPNGPASDKINAANVKEGTPVLWVSGDADRVSKFGRRLIWYRIPDHPKNKFVVISSNHLNTLSNSIKTVADWLRTL